MVGVRDETPGPLGACGAGVCLCCGVVMLPRGAGVRGVRACRGYHWCMARSDDTARSEVVLRLAREAVVHGVAPSEVGRAVGELLRELPSPERVSDSAVTSRLRAVCVRLLGEGVAPWSPGGEAGRAWAALSGGNGGATLERELVFAVWGGSFGSGDTSGMGAGELAAAWAPAVGLERSEAVGRFEAAVARIGGEGVDVERARGEARAALDAVACGVDEEHVAAALAANRARRVRSGVLWAVAVLAFFVIVGWVIGDLLGWDEEQAALEELSNPMPADLSGENLAPANRR